jgi:hypothetical protein
VQPLVRGATDSALKVRQKLFWAHLQCAIGCLIVPDVSHLATFLGRLHRFYPLIVKEPLFFTFTFLLELLSFGWIFGINPRLSSAAQGISIGNSFFF